jgi:hypothetical protein
MIPVFATLLVQILREMFALMVTSCSRQPSTTKKTGSAIFAIPKYRKEHLVSAAKRAHVMMFVATAQKD